VKTLATIDTTGLRRQQAGLPQPIGAAGDTGCPRRVVAPEPHPGELHAGIEQTEKPTRGRAMPTHIIPNNQQRTVFVTEGNSTWILEAGSKVNVPDDKYAIKNNGYDNVVYQIDGEFSNSSRFYDAGDGNTLFFGETADGLPVQSYGDSFTIENHASTMEPIDFYGDDFAFQNLDTLWGANGYAVWARGDTQNGATIENGEDALIWGSIYFNDVNGATVVNKGTIEGDDSFDGIALVFGDGNDQLINTGHLNGGIWMGNGDDTVDLRDTKSCDVTIYGNKGNDLYLVEDPVGDALVEGAGGGIDRIRTSVSQYLNDYFENLQGVGSDDIKLIGNDWNNVIIGNDGDNLLSGYGGKDRLAGGKGADRLTGGAGADLFIFNQGGGMDKVVDFSVGLDTIQLNFIAGIEDFQDVQERMTQIGNNTLINLGGRNNGVLLYGVDMENLTSNDFKIVSDLVINL
jgi:Ca2+-binding RTX toxin-like protein